MQYNTGEGCFIGMHWILIQTLTTHRNNSISEISKVEVCSLWWWKPRSFSPPRFSVIFSDCRYEHEVKKIKTGLRKSLVFFLSTNNGKNARKRN